MKPKESYKGIKFSFFIFCLIHTCSFVASYFVYMSSSSLLLKQYGMIAWFYLWNCVFCFISAGTCCHYCWPKDRMACQDHKISTSVCSEHSTCGCCGMEDW